MPIKFRDVQTESILDLYCKYVVFHKVLCICFPILYQSMVVYSATIQMTRMSNERHSFFQFKAAFRPHKMFLFYLGALLIKFWR